MAEIVIAGRPIPAIAVAVAIPVLALLYTGYTVALAEDGVMARMTMLDEKEAQLTVKQAELEELKKRSTEIATIKLEIEDLKKSITLLKQKIPGEAQVPVLLYDIERIARENQGTLNSFAPGKLQPFGSGAKGARPSAAAAAAASSSATSDIQELPVKIAATTTFPQMIKLLHAINAYERKLNISGLTVKPNSAPSDMEKGPVAFKNTLALEFTLSAYVLKTPDAAPEETP